MKGEIRFSRLRSKNCDIRPLSDHLNRNLTMGVKITEKTKEGQLKLKYFERVIISSNSLFASNGNNRWCISYNYHRIPSLQDQKTQKSQGI